MNIDKNLIQRSVAGIVFLAVMIGGVLFSHLSATLLLLLLATACSIELFTILKPKIQPTSHPLLIPVLLICVFTALGFGKLYQFNYVLLVVPVIFASISIIFFIEKNIASKVKGVFAFVFAILYAGIPFALLMFYITDSAFSETSNSVLFFFTLVWVNDTFAYVLGRLVGKTKLAHLVSPKKTVEGFVGGILITILYSLLITPYLFNTSFNDSYTVLMMSAFFVSVFATIGDLFESAIKRWLNIKDSGCLIPGHGGLLDRFDGLIFSVLPYLFFVNFKF